VLHLTEWRQYRGLDSGWLAGFVRSTKVLDARNALTAERSIEAGWTVRAIGRTLPTGA
jgi:UDPglucose 6-dehydrogenase